MNKFKQEYDDLIAMACNRGWLPRRGLEQHHILPKCLGGSNHPFNLVVLTKKEHFQAHYLLSKIYTGYSRKLMRFAFDRMKRSGRYTQKFKKKIKVKGIGRALNEIYKLSSLSFKSAIRREELDRVASDLLMFTLPHRKYSVQQKERARALVELISAG